MTFKEAFELMKKYNVRAKRPTWSGFWEWDQKLSTIMMHCKESESDNGLSVLDIRSTQRVEYTIDNMNATDWVIADESNTPILGGTLELSFIDAVNMCRLHNKRIALSYMYCEGGFIKFMKSPYGGQLYYVKDGNSEIWHPTEADMVSCKWKIVED